MHCLTVLYPQPDDPQHFKAYYAGTHVPLARLLPGVKSCSFAYPAALGSLEGVPFCIFQAWFDSAEAMARALQSEIGAEAGGRRAQLLAERGDAVPLWRGELTMLGANPIAFRMAASRFATGVAVVTAVDEQDETCGMTVNSFVTVSLSPPTVLVSVMPGRVHRAISASGRYAVNVLPEQAAALSAHFAGSPDPTSGRAIRWKTACRVSTIAWRSLHAGWCARSTSATTRCSSAKSRNAATATACRSSSSPAAITWGRAGRSSTTPEAR